jgi:hypothetical protein
MDGLHLISQSVHHLEMKRMTQAQRGCKWSRILTHLQVIIVAWLTGELNGLHFGGHPRGRKREREEGEKKRVTYT